MPIKLLSKIKTKIRVLGIFIIGLCCYSYVLIAYADNISLSSQLYSSQKSCELNGIDYPVALDFVKKFQRNVKQNNKLIIADMAEYPVRVNVRKKYFNIKNKKEFISLYSKIFTENFKSLILKQNAQNIFCNYKGAMIANGGIWFMTTSDQARFFAINTFS